MGKCEALVEEEEVEMVAPFSDGLPIRRMGRFLVPRGSDADAAGVPPVSALREAVSRGVIQWPPKKMLLEGWRSPQPKWREWVEKLRPIYRHLWVEIGIFDAIVASTYEVKRHPSVFFALLLYWCSDTNTFVFPWSEATVTLEDVMVLGGFPVLGESVRMSEPLVGDAAGLLQKMTVERKGFNKLSSKKASHYEWIKHYMDAGRCDQLEHIAFLSLWLSRFVFPAHPGKTVAENVFPLAIRLAQGMRIALGPAVLASLYRDLGMLRDSAFGSGGEDGPPVIAWAPFQILQLWAWERFLALRLDINPHHLREDEPRVARWHGLDAKLELSYVITVLESPEEFQWRPYTTHLDGWRLPSFYKDEGQWVVMASSNNDVGGVETYARFLRACELVGMDAIEQYLPHRVAMQFGLDQDLPGFVPRADETVESAWRTYNINAEEIHVYVPPRLFEADCTLNFVNWQQECFSGHTRSGEIASDPNEKATICLREKISQEDTDSSKTKSMNLEEQNGMVTPAELVHDNGISSQRKEPDLNFLQSGQLQSPKGERRLSRKRKLLNIYNGKFRQFEDAHHIGKVKVKQEMDEDHAGELFDFELRGFVKDNNSKSGAAYVPIVNDDLEGEHSPSYIRFKRKEKEERMRKELELDAQISKIKAEIAELQDSVMNMEYRPEA